MTAINVTKSQIETIVLEAIQAGAIAIGEQLDIEDLGKKVSELMKVEGENLIQLISSSAMQRYSNKK
jgi:hypothetical protein